MMQWSEGFSRTSIWYLISDDKSKAQEFFEAVTSHLSQTRDAILVFDQGYWQPDHGLWESVQGVSLLPFLPFSADHLGGMEGCYLGRGIQGTTSAGLSILLQV